MTEYARFNLRFPEDNLRELLEESARLNDRSLHAEILARLRASISEESLESRVARLEEEVLKRKRR